MCGIGGIIHFNGQPVSPDDLKKMASAMAHRGPDGEGFYTDSNLGLAHRRLSIFDLSSNSSQPFSGWGKTMIYNGAIYNYPEIRVTLEKTGYHFKTNGDTEVLLAAFDYWGEEVEEHLNGMWAFAVYDNEKRQLFLSRDRFGEKPLYYTRKDNQFVFASTLSALQSILPLKPNMKAAVRYLAFEQCEDVEQTFFDEVFKLPAAHHATLNLDSGEMNISRYYEFRYSKDFSRLSPAEAAGLLHQHIEKSVTLRLHSHVRLGSCLSGGIDSSGIVYFGQKHTPARLETVTAFSKDSRINERPFAEAISRTYNLDAYFEPMEQQNETADFLQMISMQEEPVVNASPLMQFLVMRRAQREGIKVLLDGQGADELLLGYIRYLPWYLKNVNPAKAISNIPAILTHNSLGIPDLLQMLFYHDNMALKKRRQQHKWNFMRGDWKEIIESDSKTARQEGGISVFDKQVKELTHNSLPLLLRYEDKNAMAFGVETRLPFLDPEVVEFAMNLPLEYKIRDGWTKYSWRRAMDGLLPANVVWRTRKIGFTAPRDAEKKFVESQGTLVRESEIISALSGGATLPKGDTHMQFRLTMLAAWERLHNQNFKISEM